MARKRDRFFGIFGAGLFLITSSALTILVVITLVEQHDSQASSGATSTPANTTSSSTSSTEKKVSTTKLQGTKLANFTPVTSVPNLEETDLVVGTGPVITAGETITADYTGALASTGVIFQSSLDSGQPFTSSLSGLIPGWQQGIPGMHVGGTRRLLIPAALAYGSQAQPGIPANSNLVFDITVHSAQ